MERGDVSTLRAALDRRHAVLDAAGPDVVDKRELTARLSVSRSTVGRGVRELEQLGLLERIDGGYRRTVVGSLALEEYRRSTERLEGIVESESLLSHLPSSVDIDPSVLVDAEVVRATQGSPFRPVEHTNGLIRRAHRLRTCTTTVVPPQIEVYYRAVMDDGTKLVSVTTEEAFDLFVSNHHEEIADALETGLYELYLTDQPVPYGLVVGDGPDGSEMRLTVYADDGIVGTISNDSPEAVSWANERLDDYFETAERVSLS